MRTFLPLAFWYWLYNQLFFFLGALGFFCNTFYCCYHRLRRHGYSCQRYFDNTLCIYSLQALWAFSLAQQAAAI